MIIINLLIFIFSVVGSDLNEINRANDLYKNGKFEESLEIYRKFEQFKDPDIYYNIGNCYYKLEKVGKSILYYEKALKLEPNNDNIKFNLNIAKLKTIDKIDEVPKFIVYELFENLRDSLSSNMWAIFSIFSIWSILLFFGILLYLKSPLIKRISILLIILSLFTTFLFTFFSFQKYNFEISENYAIIQMPIVYVKSAPSLTSTDLFLLHEGTKIEIINTDLNWIRLKLADGTEGWIEKNNIEKI